MESVIRSDDEGGSGQEMIDCQKTNLQKLFTNLFGNSQRFPCMVPDCSTAPDPLQNSVTSKAFSRS